VVLSLAPDLSTPGSPSKTLSGTEKLELPTRELSRLFLTTLPLQESSIDSANMYFPGMDTTARRLNSDYYTLRVRMMTLERGISTQFTCPPSLTIMDL